MHHVKRKLRNFSYEYIVIMYFTDQEDDREKQVDFVVIRAASYI
jgi:hypothetical protein